MILTGKGRIDGKTQLVVLESDDDVRRQPLVRVEWVDSAQAWELSVAGTAAVDLCLMQLYELTEALLDLLREQGAPLARLT